MKTLTLKECQTIHGGLDINTEHTVDYAIAGSVLGGVVGVTAGAFSNGFVGATMGLIGGAALGSGLFAAANVAVESDLYQDNLHVEFPKKDV